MGKFLVKSYAKINIALNVLDKKEDGYHELDSIMVPLELHDSLIVSEHYKDDNFVTIDDFSIDFSDYNITSLAIDSLSSLLNKVIHCPVIFILPARPAL